MGHPPADSVVYSMVTSAVAFTSSVVVLTIVSTAVAAVTLETAKTTTNYNENVSRNSGQ